jgi:hypothetical protein
MKMLLVVTVKLAQSLYLIIRMRRLTLARLANNIPIQRSRPSSKELKLLRPAKFAQLDPT